MKKVVAVITILLIILGVVYFNSYKNMRTFDMDGYIFTSDNITKNLVNGDDKTTKIDYSKVKYSDYLYKGRGKYFIGDRRKVGVNLDYPVVSKDSKTLLLLSDQYKLIDTKYRKTNSYSNSLISDNKLFNENDYERADNITYIFIDLGNSIIVNLSEITIETTKKHTIPVNSFISFSEEHLRYYYMDSGRYFYKEIRGLDKNATIEFNNKKMGYLEFLERLGLFLEEEEENVDVELPPEVVQEEEQEEVKNTEETKGSGDLDYVKPEITFSGQSANIYSVSGKLEIYDPTGRIVKYPTFEFYKGKTLVYRKTFVTSDRIEAKGLFPNTEYDVIGYFHYKNEEGKEIKREFTSFKIATKDISGLENIDFSIDKIVPYSNHAEFNGMKLNNKSTDEVLKGVKKVILKVGSNNYQLSTGIVSKLVRLESYDYTTGKSLNSNTKYDIKLEFYDVSGNLLKQSNNNYSFKTTKKAPSGNLSVKSRSIDKATLYFDLTNKDDVNITNMKYVVYDNEKNIVKQARISDMTIQLDNLSPNEVYSVALMGDFDLEDGNGIVREKVIIDGKFTTEPLSTLGYVKLDFSNIVTDTNSASFNVTISDDTNSILKSLLTGMTIVLRDSDGNDSVKTIVLTSEQLERMKNGELLPFTINGLESNHTYYFELSSVVALGNKENNIITNSNVVTIKTMKYEAEVDVINKFVTESVINFDVRVDDLDDAIQSKRVLLEVRNNLNVLVLYEEITPNTDYKNISLEKLAKDTTYTFKYIVEEYNTGYTNSTFKTNYVLYSEQIVTTEGLSGKVEVDSLLKQITSKNIFDIDNSRRWKTAGNREPSSRKVNKTDNTITLSAKNGYRTYSYYLQEYAGQKVTVSFKIKYKNKNYTKPVYLTDRGSNNSYSANDQIKNVTADDYISYSRTLTINSSSPYISFHIIEVDGENETTEVVIKDLQIEVGTSATSYVPYKEKDNYMGTFLTTLIDKKHEIEQDDFHYFLRYYKDNELIDTVQFDFNDTYKVEKEMSKHEIYPSSDYVIKLSIRKNVVGVSSDKRYYDLATLNFTSDDEIRTIHNINEFYAMHTSGFYLVSEDLDFRNQTRVINSDVNFNGIVDFQGHKVYRDTSTNGTTGVSSRYLIYRLGSNGILRNLDVHYYFDGYEINDYNGLTWSNYGTIENVMVTLEQGNSRPNTVISLITRENYGIVKNFVVNSKESLSLARDGALVVFNNYGTISDGYVYGKAIDARFNNPSLSNKYVGVIARYCANNSYIANIYSLVDVDLLEGLSSTTFQYEVGNITGPINRTIIRNVYTNSSGKNRNNSVDVNIYSASAINRSNVYYATKDIYSGAFSNKIAPNALRQEQFQEILNANNAFDISSYVKYGYYPHLIWPDVMPNQEYIELPKENDGIIDYLSMENRVEFDNETVEATLIFDNIGFDYITGLTFSDNLHAEILSQENIDGKSKVRVRFSSPQKYVTQYSLTRIKHEDSSGRPGTDVTYGDKERVVEVEMYRNINSMADFRTMQNNLAQNFKLQTDLDFSNLNENLGTFTGRFDGNGHTIRNIRLSGKAFITTLSTNGTVKNLFVENYTKDGASTRGGFIATANGNSNIVNVHLKHVSITDSDQRIGGLVGYTDGALISNSSVTDVHIYQKDKNNVKYYGRYGGFIGENNNTVIQNCYAQDVNIEILYGSGTYGIGGFVGRHNSGYIQDSYVQGTINTNQQEVGGIAGYSSGYIERVIDVVDIYSQQDSVGGIVGYSTNDNIYNTLVIGGVYTSKNAINQNRTIGNRIAVNSNYAWNEQLVNGLNANSANGDIFLTSEELKSATTYDSLIKFGNQFSLDKLSNSKGRNIIPKLKYLASDELLPNQKDIEFYVRDFKVRDIAISRSFSDATIQIFIQNPDNYQVKDLKVDGFNIIRVNKNITANGETLYEIYGTPDKYYDSYLISKITYNDGTQDVSINPSAKIDVSFYKDIGTFEDWQNIDGDVYENYRLVADIDFAGKTNVKSRVSFNRLEGTDEGHTLKNITLTASAPNVGLIDTVAANITNVNFENITINSTYNTPYTGIIRFLNGTMTDVNFSDINITSKGSYTGIVAYNQSPDIKRVSIDTVTMTGVDYIGGFAAYSRTFDIAYLSGTNINLTGTSQRVGGLIGSIDTVNTTYVTMFNLTVDGVTVKGGNYVGGIFGYGSGSYMRAHDVHATGASYVGGFAGNGYVTYSNYGYISDSEVTGSGDNIGGGFGYSYDLRYFYVDNVKVTATRPNANNYVGGLSGRSSYTRYYSGVKNSTIVNAGDQTGGLTGRLENAGIQRCYVYNTTVTGAKYVGGLVGYHSSTSSSVYYSISNATVKATVDYAGGIIGYLDNINTTSATNKIYLYQNIVANSDITSAGERASSMAPNSNKLPYDGHFYKNFIVANVHSASNDKSRFFVGNSNDNTYSSYENTAGLREIRVYENSTFNGESIKNYTYPSNVTKYSYNNLKVQATYKEILESYFNYTTLANGEFPFLTYEWNDIGYQHFMLPEEPVNMGNSGSIGRVVGSIPSYPLVNVYASDVDKINVEFDKVMNGIKFKINGTEYLLDRLTYTFYYDFTKDFDIEISDGINTTKLDYKADDLIQTSSVIDNNYYYIENGKIKSNDDVSIKEMKNDNFQYRVLKLAKNNNNSHKPINIYEDKILLENHNIYSIPDKKVIENSIKNFELYSSTPIYSFQYGDSTIDTYYNYSIIDGNYISKQVFVKEGNIETIDSSLDAVKDSVLIDKYNGNNHLIYLGTDGKLHSLKDNISIPRSFVNKNIKAISTDIYNNSDIIFVSYENGDYVVFNYRNGKIIEQSMKNTSSNVLSYFGTHFTNDRVANNRYNDYKESLDLINKLKKKSTDKVLNNDESNEKASLLEDTYISTYNSATNKYEVFKINSANDSNNAVLSTQLSSNSTSNMIDNNVVLYNYYIGTEKRNQTILLSVLGIVVILFLGIATGVIMLRFNIGRHFN